MILTGYSQCLAERRRVQQAALGPLRIKTTRQVKGRIWAQVTIIDLAIVANLSKDLYTEVMS